MFTMEKKSNTSKKPTSPKIANTNGKSQNGNGKPSVSKNSRGQSADGMLEEYFHDSLKDIYWAEKHLVKALPKMIKASTTAALQNAIEEHLEVTKVHVERLEQVFELLGYKPQAKKCDAMEGLTKEADSIIEETEANTMTRDAGIIMAAQKVEHYEIATYGSLVQLAKTLGMNDAAEILHQTLEEEKQADEKLTEIAEWNVNQAAAQEAGKEEENEEEEEKVETEEEV